MRLAYLPPEILHQIASVLRDLRTWRFQPVSILIGWPTHLIVSSVIDEGTYYHYKWLVFHPIKQQYLRFDSYEDIGSLREPLVWDSAMVEQRALRRFDDGMFWRLYASTGRRPEANRRTFNAYIILWRQQTKDLRAFYATCKAWQMIARPHLFLQ